MGVETFEEFDGSPVEEWAGRPTATRALKTDWDSRIAVGSSLFSQLYPFPGPVQEAGAICVSVLVRPWGRAGEWAQGSSPRYDFARIDLRYEIPDVTLLPNPTYGFISESIEPYTEFITLDSRNFRWGSGNGDVLNSDEAPGKLIRGFEWRFSRYQLSGIPVGILSLDGTCNATTIVSPSLGLTFGPQTLLFQPPQIERDPSNPTLLHVHYRFSSRRQGWNRFWRAKTQSWEDLYVAGGLKYFNFPPAEWNGVL